MKMEECAIQNRRWEMNEMIKKNEEEEEHIFVISNYEDDILRRLLNPFSNDERNDVLENTATKNISEFNANVTSLLNAFYSRKDASQLLDDLKCLDCSAFHSFFVLRAIRTSLDKSQEERQLISTALTLLFNRGIITKEDITWGFEKLVQSIGDLFLDVPYAAEYLYTLLEQALQDECVDASLIHRLPETFLSDITSVDVEAPLTILRTYKQEVRMFLKTFFLKKCVEVVKDFLESDRQPQLRHEFIRLMITESMEKLGNNWEMVLDVLMAAYGSLISGADMQFAFSRLIGSINDLSQTIVNASYLLTMYLVRSVVEGLLHPSFIQDGYRLHLGGSHGMSCLKLAQKWFDTKSGPFMRFPKQKRWKNTNEEEYYKFDVNLDTLVSEFLGERSNVALAKSIYDMEMTTDKATALIRKLVYCSIKASRASASVVSNMLSLIKQLFDTHAVHEESIVAGFQLAHGDASTEVDFAQLSPELLICAEYLKSLLLNSSSSTSWMLHN